MIMPQGLILPYPSTYASIPANWTQEATLVDKFIKAWGSANVGDTGGASSHAHTGIAHTHTETDVHGHVVSFQANNSSQTFGGGTNSDPITQVGHNHPNSTITTRSGGDANTAIPYPATANNNHPPNMRVIFLKAGVGAVLTDGFLTLWNSATIPDGYLMCSDGLNGAPALGNLYFQGASASGDGGAIAGSLTHVHDLTHNHVTSHTHSDYSATDDNHPSRTNGGSGGHKVGSHEHLVTLNSANVTTDTYSGNVTSAQVEPAFKKLIALYKNGGAVRRGMIGIWIGDINSLPKGWLLCDGRAWSDGVTFTPDLRDSFIKIANDTAELGATGGSNTHAHVASNSHAHSQSGAHNHTAGVGSVNDSGSNSGSSTSSTSHNHGVNSVGNNNATATWGTSTMSAETVDNQPEHVVVAFIQLEKITRPHGSPLNV